MASKRQRPRTARREAARRIDKVAAARRKLAALEAGGSLEQPIVVDSASQIDGAARALRCARCDLGLFIEGERGDVHAGRVMRTVELGCRQCGEKRTAYFAIDRVLQ